MKKILTLISIIAFSFGCQNVKDGAPENELSLIAELAVTFEFSPINIFFMDGIGATDLNAVQNAVERADKLVKTYNDDLAHTKKYKIIDYDLQNIQRGRDETVAIIKVIIELIVPPTP